MTYKHDYLALKFAENTAKMKNDVVNVVHIAVS